MEDGGWREGEVRRGKERTEEKEMEDVREKKDGEGEGKAEIIGNVRRMP